MDTILIVDDDKYISELLTDALTRENYNVLRAYSGTEALFVLDKVTPDLILLDLMLPGLSGEELIGRLRGIPVIVVSAKTDVESKVSLLLGGAVDYVTKPFELKELLARIRLRLMTGSRREDAHIISAGGLTLEPDLCRCASGGKETKLTKTECAILKILMLNAPNVVTKSALLDKLSFETPDCVESSLKVHVSNLRKKLRECTEDEYIESVWGIGFRFTKS